MRRTELIFHMGNPQALVVVIVFSSNISLSSYIYHITLCLRYNSLCSMKLDKQLMNKWMNISLNRPVISIFYGDANNNIKLLSIPLAKTYFHKWHIKGGWGGGVKVQAPVKSSVAIWFLVYLPNFYFMTLMPLDQCLTNLSLICISIREYCK